MNATHAVRVAMAQITVVPGAVDENMERGLEAIKKASDLGAEVVVLPECLDVGWLDASVPRYAQQIPGPRTDCFAAASRRHGLYVVAGLTERSSGRIYNAAVMTSPEGELLIRHRKINELSIGREVYSVGSQLEVADTRFGPVAVNICADNLPEALELGHAQGRMGAVALFSPCAWAVPADHDPIADPYDGWDAPYRKLATAHEMAVVGVSNVGWIRSGPWAGHRCIGASLAIGQHGEVLARAPYGVEASEVLVLDVELDRRT